MSQKFDNFLPALEALCKEHRVVITPGSCVAMEVWDDDASPSPGAMDDFVDCTKETP